MNEMNISPIDNSDVTFQKSNVVIENDLVESICQIPDQLAFKIGDVAEMAGIKQYVLRYWETEFECLRPRKSKNGQRVYSRKDVETIFLIKSLLYSQRFSIEGARAAIKKFREQTIETKDWKQVGENIEKIRNDLVDLANDIHRIKSLFE